jgi:CubicO group peptidase (beta-lactamase class C family)
MERPNRWRSLKAWGFYLSCFLAIGAEAKTPTGYCPPLGAVLPAPKTPSSDATVKASLQTLKTTFESFTSNFSQTAISIGVQSIHENAPLLDLHHTPATSDNRSTTTVNSKTVYRLGSITKLFPVLAVLQLPGVNWEDPVTKFLPELSQLKNQVSEVNELTVVDWDSLTIGALASHLSGLGAQGERIIHEARLLVEKL